MRLHIGGEEIKEGWKILNIQKKPGVDFIGDITDLSQFDDKSVEEIYASHVLEHIGISLVVNAVNEIFRILKQGGRLYVSVPDLEVLTKLFLAEPEGGNKYNLMRMIYGGQTDKYDYHYSGFWPDSLYDLLKNAGFASYEKVDFFNIFNDTSSLQIQGVRISLNVVAIK
jgi:predicted SAM-dependent methyltransferase